MSRSSARWLLWCITSALVTWDGPALSAGEPVWYGGIEIGSKGVKMVAVPIGDAGAPNLSQLIQKSPKATNNVTLAERTPDGSFQAEAIDEARAVVATYHAELSGRLRIPPERLWVVASSGLLARGRPKNFDAVQKAVLQATGGDESLIEIDQGREVDLLILGAIPRERLGDTVLLDVGSGNSKLGYRESKVGFNAGRSVIVSAKIDGAVGFKQSARARMEKAGKRGFEGFREVASELRAEIDAKLAGEIGRKPGLINRPKVALLGGVPWAVGMLVDPERMVEEDLYFDFRLDQLREFHAKLRQTGRVPIPNIDNLPEQVRNEVGRARDLFTPEDFLAGSEILLGFAQALQWEEQKKDVYFVKSGVIAWIVAYVEEAREK